MAVRREPLDGKRQIKDMPEEKQKLVIETLKAGVLFTLLLSDFERGLIMDRACAYATYANHTSISDDQLKVLEEIANKLNL